MKQPLSAGGRAFQEAVKNGDMAAVRRMRRKAAQTRAEKRTESPSKPRTPEDPMALLRTVIAEREAEAALERRVNAGEVRIDPETGEIIELYSPADE